MTDDTLLPSTAAVGAFLLAMALGGWFVAGALLGPGRAFRWERIGWGFAVGLLLVSSAVALSFSFGLRPSLPGFSLVFGLALVLGRVFRLRDSGRESPNGVGPISEKFSLSSLLLAALLLGGIAIYMLRALAEPMWSNDFFAVWGLKGKTMFGEAGISPRLIRWPSWSFSRPEYPLGVPLVYAGIAFLLGRWDDHALALLFPLWALATLAVLYGWLRRRGSPRTLALAACALLIHFGPLYSSFLAGMADVPLSFAFLLLGTALSDLLDGTDAGAPRRLAFASFLAASTKNEGMLLVGLALAGVLLRALKRRRDSLPRLAAGVLLLPALLSAFLHRLALGKQPLQAFDLGYLMRPGFSSRVSETLAAEAELYRQPVWLVLIGSIGILILLGRRVPHADRLLLLAGACQAVYLAIPVFCVFGPAWLVQWSSGRLSVVLIPLVAAAVAARLVSLYSAPPLPLRPGETAAGG